jgi:hypothetical protein
LHFRRKTGRSRGPFFFTKHATDQCFLTDTDLVTELLALLLSVTVSFTE